MERVHLNLREKYMKCLVVIAHPVKNSLCQTLAEKTVSTLLSNGHQVTVRDLYKLEFSSELTCEERKSYYSSTFDQKNLKNEINDLLEAEALILVFPTWWFNFPALLKGWFDRVWAPGIAYDHANDLGAITSKLNNLKHTVAITSLGSPWWVDKFIMRQPVKKILKMALLGTCAPKSTFRILSIYNAEKLNDVKVSKFLGKIEKNLLKL